MKLIVSILAIVFLTSIGYSQDHHFLGSRIYPLYGDLLPLDQKIFIRSGFSFFSSKKEGFKYFWSLSGPVWIEERFWIPSRTGFLMGFRNVPKNTPWFGFGCEIINTKLFYGPYAGMRYGKCDFEFQYFWNSQNKTRDNFRQLTVRFNF
ncbi:MAG: hypothetical protein QMD50_01265 [Patescibacteria group bacterium]|nr:hypothetical protein [Patescibacteria group bacterium]